MNRPRRHTVVGAVRIHWLIRPRNRGDLAYKLCAPRPHASSNGCTLGASSVPALVSVLPSGGVAVSVAVGSWSADDPGRPSLRLLQREHRLISRVCGYQVVVGMDLEQWQAVAERHRQCDDDSRRCRDCQAYWPCSYRLQAERQLVTAVGTATTASQGPFVMA